MKFQVPQFIEIEDKIVGPLTLKQFIYLAGAGGICIIFYSFLPLYIAVIFMLPAAALGAALAFLKINNKPFVQILEAFFKYVINGKLYIWKQGRKTSSTEGKSVGSTPDIDSLVPRLTKSKLKELTWSLDVKEHNEELKRYKEGKE